MGEVEGGRSGGRLRGGATSAPGAGAWQEGGIRAGYTPVGANGVRQGVGPLALMAGRLGTAAVKLAGEEADLNVPRQALIAVRMMISGRTAMRFEGVPHRPRRASGGTQRGARTCAFVAGRAAHVDICTHKNERRCINTGRKNGRRAASVLKLCGLLKVNDRKMQNISARIHLHHKKRAPRGRKARFNRIIIDKAGQR